MHTVEWDKEPDVTAGNPLPNTVSGALLRALHEGSVIDDAVEDLFGYACRVAAARVRACLTVAHLGSAGIWRDPGASALVSQLARLAIFREMWDIFAGICLASWALCTEERHDA